MCQRPITAVLALQVFTYAGSTPELDAMLKEAVTTAWAARLSPICVYHGTEASIAQPMFRWLTEQGVTVVLHSPAWLHRLRAAATAATPAAATPAGAHQRTPASAFASLLGDFLRVDIPILPQLQQHEYVLYTDADVLFRRPITLQSFGQPLPAAAAMARSGAGGWPCNAGVLLMHLPSLRATHREFVAATFALPTLDFGAAGTGVSGAYSGFYAGGAGPRRCTLPERFNSIVHRHPALDTAAIMHFQGPKPEDYLRWRATGDCGGQPPVLCARGYKVACRLLRQHSAHLPACDGAAALH